MSNMGYPNQGYKSKVTTITINENGEIIEEVINTSTYTIERLVIGYTTAIVEESIKTITQENESVLNELELLRAETQESGGVVDILKEMMEKVDSQGKAIAKLTKAIDKLTNIKVLSHDKEYNKGDSGESSSDTGKRRRKAGDK